MGGAKIPGILVTQPKGTARGKEAKTSEEGDQGPGPKEERKEEPEQRINWPRGGRRGTKRYKYLGDDSKMCMFPEEEDGEVTSTQEQEAPKQNKRRRSRSPVLLKPLEPPKDSKFVSKEGNS